MSNQKILIIGGGISGVTTGIVLQMLGFSTHIVCAHWLGDTDKALGPSHRDPRFASLYPAASVIPHTVHIDDFDWHLKSSLRIFTCLQKQRSKLLRPQRHYEIFESPRSIEPYAPQMPRFAEVTTGHRSLNHVPRRGSETPIYGWSFEALFVEMPAYRQFLAELYLQLGGTVDRATITRDTLRSSSSRVIMNCAGAWGPVLFDDADDSWFVKGILVRVNTGGEMPRHHESRELFSYNYHPDASVYANPDGSSADVYFYPRSDVCLLGGTRLCSDPLTSQSVGPLTANAVADIESEWRGEVYNGPTIRIPLEGSFDQTVAVPAPIIELNSALVQSLTSFDLKRCPMTAMIGYRHRRQRVRLGSESWHDHRVVHNYGHGGAGVTLSWSSAVRAAQWAMQDQDLDEILQRVVTRVAEL
jgi:glycine/D-amino acid oxidase-like deaminating enzyme